MTTLNIATLSKDKCIYFFPRIGCQLETLSSNTYQTFYPTKTFYNENGVLEFLVRFKGIADGHIILTTNNSDVEPRYSVSLLNK